MLRFSSIAVVAFSLLSSAPAIAVEKDDAAKALSDPGVTVKPLFGSRRKATESRLSPDRKRLLLWRYRDRWLELWDVAKDKPLRVWKTDEQIVTAAFSEDAKHVMTYGIILDDGETFPRSRLWSVKREKPLKTFEKKLNVRLVNKECTRCMSVDGAGADVAPIISIALLWDISGAAPKLQAQTAMSESDPVTYHDIRFTHNSLRFFAVCGIGPTHTLWDVKKKKPVLRFQYWAHKAGRYLARHPGSGRYLSWRETADDDQPKLMLWTAKEREREIGLKSKLKGAAFHPDGDRILTWGHLNGTIRLRDGKSLKPIRKMSAMKSIRGAIFHPDGNTFATWHGRYYDHGAFNAVQLWETRTGKLLRTFLTKKPVHSVVFHPRKRVLAAEHPKAVSLWHAAVSKPLKSIATRDVLRMHFLAHGERLFIEPVSGSPMLYALEWK